MRIAAPQRLLRAPRRPTRAGNRFMPFRRKLRDKHPPVLLDLGAGQLTVDRKKVDLSEFDNANGVVVEVQIGNIVAVESITMQPAPGNKLIYDAASMP